MWQWFHKHVLDFDYSNHLIPLHDTYPHTTEGTCWCDPELISESWYHKAADGRLDYEECLRKVH